MDSIRLEQILKFIPDGVGVADIGTDHAQIPIYLARHTHCHPLIAGEKTRGPYEVAAYRIKEAGLGELIDLRLGSGLTIIRPGEISWAVIAGMGFKTIIQIITESEEIARSLHGIILQPMQGADEMRRWLAANYFQITDELLVKEDGKLFQIMVVRDGAPVQVDEIFAEVGPLLYEKCDPLLEEHVLNLISYHEEVRSQIPDSSDRAAVRRAELTERIGRLKEVLAQWQKRCSE